MSFWRYFKGKLSGLGYIVLGFALIAIGALALSYLGITLESVGKISWETGCCLGSGILVAVGAMVIAYGQRKLQKLDES